MDKKQAIKIIREQMKEQERGTVRYSIIEIIIGIIELIECEKCKKKT